MWKSKGTRVSKTLLKMINKVEGMTLPGFKTYIAKIIKTVVLTEGQTCRSMKTENPETD